MGVILLGVGATLFALTALIETLVDGRFRDAMGRRRMQNRIDDMNDHVIICGCGRVGREIADEVERSGRDLVLVDLDEGRLADAGHPYVAGDATQDAVLLAAGIERASALVAAVDADAANAFVILSSRAIRPDIFLVARARSADSEKKLRRSGADRVVNPQSIGGSRMAAFVVRPNVAEFLDVVMHEANLEFRLEELEVGPRSPIVGRTLRDAQLRDKTGALVLALRDPAGNFLSNPPPETTFGAGHVLIAIGTEPELVALGELVRE
jgi:voltage-gated potassium channel